MGWSGWATVDPSVLVIDRSTRGVNGSVSVAELLPGAGSITPVGAATVAVLVMVPVALGDAVPLIVYVTVDPTGRLTASLIEPEPEAVQAPPPDAEHVQVGATSTAGIASTTGAPTAADGPRLVTATVS